MAELSRVNLSEAEIVRLEKEFREIFEYFSSIKKISGQTTYFANAAELRTDEAKPKTHEEADAIIGNFAEKDNRLMRAPKALG